MVYFYVTHAGVRTPQKEEIEPTAVAADGRTNGKDSVLREDRLNHELRAKLTSCALERIFRGGIFIKLRND